MFKKISIAVAILAVIGIIVLWPKISLYFAGSKKTLNEKQTAFFFDAKSGLEGLADQLEEQKLIGSKDAA